MAAIDVIAAVGSAPELLDAENRLKPDAVVADIRMPPGHTMEGIDAAHTIRAQRSAIGVVILSQYADPTYALALFENGTAGLAYLLKRPHRRQRRDRPRTPRRRRGRLGHRPARSRRARRSTRAHR